VDSIVSKGDFNRGSGCLDLPLLMASWTCKYSDDLEDELGTR
jgi:hypothetical protein